MQANHSYRGPGGRCVSRYRVMCIRKCSDVPSPSLIPWSAVWVGHIIKLLPQRDEAINQSLGDLQMGIGLCRAMDDQEVSFEAFGKIDRSGSAVPLGVLLGGIVISAEKI